MITALLLLAAAPTKIAALANPGGWVTNADYPLAAQRDGIEGTTTFRLDVTAQGTVSNCTVLISSGSDLLDETTCRLTSQRARFAPGRDRRGRAIAGTYQNRVRWQVQKPSGNAFLPPKPFNAILRLEVDPTGKTIGCTYTGPMPIDAAERVCESAKAAPAITPFTDASGKPVGKIVTLRQSATFEDR
jgi:TonB family protein